MNNVVIKKNIKETLFLAEINGVVSEVSQGFADITGYSVEELISNNINDVFHRLRIGPEFDYKNIDFNKEYFLFTKTLEPRFIRISKVSIPDGIIYEFLELENSRLNSKLPFANKLCLDNYYGIAIYSLPDITLLKANETFISFLDEPYNRKESCVGKRIEEFIKGYKGSSLEKIWKKVLETGEIYNIDEYVQHNSQGICTYRKGTFTPIVEDGDLKYCVVMLTDITNEVLSRKKAQEQNKKLAAIIENMSDIISIYDKGGNQLDLNEAGKDMREKYGKGYMSIRERYAANPPYDSQDNIVPFEKMPAMRAINGEKFKNMRITYKVPKVMHLKVNGGPIYDKDGNFIMAMICMNDVTKEVERENLIKQQQQLLETVIQSLDVGIYVSDKNGKFLITNEESKRQTYDYVNIDALGQAKKHTTFCDMEGNEVPYEQMPGIRALRGEKVLNTKLWLKRPDNNMYLDSTAIPLFNSKGELTNVVACCRDITKIIEKEKELEKQKKLLEAIVDNLKQALYVSDKQGKFIIMNKAARERWGKRFGDFRDTHDHANPRYLDGTIQPKEETATHRAMRGIHTRNHIVYYYNSDGEKRYSLLNGVPIFDYDGDILYGITTTNDITDFMENQLELKETQEKLLNLEQEKNEVLKHAIEMKDEFLSLISHELRTPLNVISSAVQAIHYLCKDDLSDKTKKYINMIKQNANRQLRLVNNLLDITRADAGRIKINKKNIDIVFLTKSITESVNTYAFQKGIRLLFASTFKFKVIGMDEEKYERIILNLLSNAIKFTPGGKTIKVSVSREKNNIEIKVKDSGIGIPEDKINIIFERFGQVDSSLSRRAEGTGIGLSLVKKFVDALDGSISVESKVGRGSTFIISFPDTLIQVEQEDKEDMDLMDNRLVQVTNVEFSDIYL